MCSSAAGDATTSSTERPSVITSCYEMVVAQVSVVVGDITTLKVDVVVNAANPQLLAGGGVCGAIFAAAGHEELTASCQQIGSCPTGSAVITPAHGLAMHGVRFIVHAVGPIWDEPDPSADDGRRLLDAQLASAYAKSMEIAASAGARSIAFPAISTGIYGFPPERAASIAVASVLAFKGPIEQVLLVAFDERTADGLRSEIESAV